MLECDSRAITGVCRSAAENLRSGHASGFDADSLGCNSHLLQPALQKWWEFVRAATFLPPCVTRHSALAHSFVATFQLGRLASALSGAFPTGLGR